MLDPNKNQKNKILNHLFSIIIDELKFTNPKAIIIYGSYGRNEGAWIKENNNLVPYNDFDIVVINDSKNKLKEKRNISELLKKKLKVEWIDLQFMSTYELKKLNKKTIFNFDLKFGSKIIYGDKKILDKIPLSSSKNIDINDLEVLFNTRLWTFYGSYKSFENMDSKSSRFFKYQMSKAILATVESFLIRNNYYNCSYRNKVKEYIKLSNNNHEFVKWALNEKLNPSEDIISSTKAIKLLNDTKRIFFQEFFASLSEITKLKIKSSKDLLVYRSSLKMKIRCLVKYILLGEKNIFKKNHVKDLELIISNSNKENDLYSYEPFFSKKLEYLNLNFQNFNDLRHQISDLRFKI